MAKVTIVQRVLPHYRIPLFTQLAEILAKDGIELNLVYGQELQGTVPKTFDFNAPWAHRIKNAYFKVFGYEVVWQPCLQMTKGSDLIIVEQANRLLVNYAYLLLRKAGNFKLAYWGHGKNMNVKSGQNMNRENFKRLLVNQVDWWFAYTEASARVVLDSGMPQDKISQVMNSVDTGELEKGVCEATPERLDQIRNEIGITSNNVGVFCAGMNREKCLDFLIATCLKIREKLPDFEMLFIGSGPEQSKVEKASIQYPWIHYVGPRYGTEKVAYLMLGKALLMPGLVGLVIIDSFVTQRPLITTDIPGHGPEIDYLKNETNGILFECSLETHKNFVEYLNNAADAMECSADSVEKYSEVIVSYFKSADMQSALKNGCAVSARKYSLENMVLNFSDGIKRCLLGNSFRETPNKSSVRGEPFDCAQDRPVEP